MQRREETQGGTPKSGHPACPNCGKLVDPLRARALAVVGGKVISFCSAVCKEQGAAPRVAEPILDGAHRPPAWRWVVLASVGVVLAGVLLGARVSFDNRPATAALPQHVAPPPPPPEPRPEELPFGPEPPPSDFFLEGETWCHPLPGPLRRLPDHGSRRFGAERDHDAPDSCGKGHCGNDIGELKGEPILAIHDGTVERVVREEHASGGRHLRLLHRNGTFVSQYFHLDEVDEKLRPGLRVRAGDKLGTLGDTGIRYSTPHLHFTVSTRKAENAPDVFIDPEPLLTLWPLCQH